MTRHDMRWCTCGWSFMMTFDFFTRDKHAFYKTQFGIAMTVDSLDDKETVCFVLISGRVAVRVRQNISFDGFFVSIQMLIPNIFFVRKNLNVEIWCFYFKLQRGTWRCRLDAVSWLNDLWNLLHMVNECFHDVAMNFVTLNNKETLTFCFDFYWRFADWVIP